MNLPSANTVTATPAALGWRLLAIVYDVLPLLGIWFAIAAIYLLLRGGEPVTPNTAAAWLELALMLLAGFGYFGLSWRRGGQTLGMRAWRVRVIGTDGRAPTWSMLSLRYVVAGVSLAAFGAGFLWSVFDPERRTWHDIASATILVRTGSRSSRRVSRDS
jgi:uncharacterized RDD family membrane protein YckC